MRGGGCWAFSLLLLLVGQDAGSRVSAEERFEEGKKPWDERVGGGGRRRVDEGPIFTLAPFNVWQDLMGE